MAREKLFTVTLKDCRVDRFRGSGKGGQKRNKTETGIRITHLESGAVGQSDDTREQRRNRSIAFKRMANSKKFQEWLRIETARATGKLQQIEELVDREMVCNTKIEAKENGKWVKFQ